MFNKRLGALILALALALILNSAAFALTGTSTQGMFATQVNETVYASLYTGSDYGLYSVPAGGGDMTLLDRGAAIDELLAVGTNLFYIKQDASTCSVRKVDAEGAVTTLSEFENGVQVSHLSWYDDILYCIAGGRLFLVDPENGDNAEHSTEELTDYAIVNDVIFYISDTDVKEYQRTVSGQTDTVSQSSGTLWSMSILGTNPEQLLDKGISDLSAIGATLYFHNLEDNYIMGSDNDMWLEGKLYRYNIETGQAASMNIPYDWDYYPTDAGVVVYTSQNISLYPLSGGDGQLLLEPGTRTNICALGNTAYIYEYDVGKFTLLPLDGGDSTVLVDESDVLPGNDEGETVLVDDTQAGVDDADAATDDTGEEGLEDASYDEDTDTTSSGTSSSYIFPNSSKKKLTRKQVLAIDKSLWGYARNEIYARNGYSFKNSKYSSYFKKKSWYSPGGFSTSKLNSIEWYNMDLIKSLEQEYGLISGTSSSSSSSSNSSAKNNYYILKEARTKKLSKAYIRKKLGGSKSKYALARNEILARHGYVFKTAKYRKYFKNQKWYKAGGYSSSKVSTIEWYNIKQLKALEAS